MKKNIEVQVSQETYDVGLFVGNLLKAVAEAYSDGKFEIASELPPIIISSITDLISAMNNVSAVKAEFSEDIPASVMAIQIPVTEGVFSLIKSLKK